MIFLLSVGIFGCNPTNQRAYFDTGAVTFNGYQLELESVVKIIESNQIAPIVLIGKIDSSHTLTNHSDKELRLAWPPRRVDFLGYDSLNWNVKDVFFEVLDVRSLTDDLVSLKPGESFHFRAKVNGIWHTSDPKKPFFFSFVFSGCGEDEPNVVNVVGSITSEKPARLK
jgi:hypothetical protein